MMPTNEVNWDFGTDTLCKSFSWTFDHESIFWFPWRLPRGWDRLLHSDRSRWGQSSGSSPSKRQLNLPWDPSCGLLSHLQLSRLQFHCVCLCGLSALCQLQVSAAVALEEWTKWFRFQTEWRTARRSLCGGLGGRSITGSSLRKNAIFNPSQCFVTSGFLQLLRLVNSKDPKPPLTTLKWNLILRSLFRPRKAVQKVTVRALWRKFTHRSATCCLDLKERRKEVFLC